MSAATRQHTCSACGHWFDENDAVTVEPLIDPAVRYVAVCWSCSTFPPAKAGVAKAGETYV